VLSICQSLPGLNASNTAILVGDRLHSELRDWNSDVAHAYSEKSFSQSRSRSIRRRPEPEWGNGETHKLRCVRRPCRTPYPGRDTVRGARYISQITTSPPRPYSAAGSQPRSRATSPEAKAVPAARHLPLSQTVKSPVCCFRRRIFWWLRSRTTAQPLTAAQRGELTPRRNPHCDPHRTLCVRPDALLPTIN
jgi:hypothetical protein